MRWWLIFCSLALVSMLGMSVVTVQQHHTPHAHQVAVKPLGDITNVVDERDEIAKASRTMERHLEHLREVKQARREARREAREEAQRQAALERQARAAASTNDFKRYALERVGAEQFGCLDALWELESSWSVTETNSSSGAYGIPQALPGSKMASAGADWATNGYTQIDWGLSYISGRYGTPCAAWAHSQAYNWY